MILLLSGGHGFKVLKKLEMLEIKQRPFIGEKDKKRLENDNTKIKQNNFQKSDIIEYKEAP